ncbi:DUF803-domain-containing protein, partial [Westerdykella ornata]
GYSPENWSSLIGIVTAIVGNVLISFALNLQRYAHIRIGREWKRRKEEETRRRKEMDKKKRSGRGRGQQNERDGEVDGDVEVDIDATEDDPLLPASHHARFRNRRTAESNNTSSSLSSSSTVAATQEAYKQKSYLKSPWWWAGIILMTTGEAGNFLAYGFAPASIVSPLGVVALISNCIIAPIMLKEVFRKRDGLGVLVAVGGAVTVVASASSDNPKLGPEDIWGLITTWEFETYLGVTVGVIGMLMVASNRFGEKNILIDLGLVGLFGGYTALSTKGVASMLSYTLWHALTFPVTYLLVAILIFTAIMQIKYVNRALQRFDATQVIPVQFVLFTLSVILGSAILYRDFERTSGKQAGKFVGGCAMTFLGVWLITSGRHQRRETDEEEAIHLHDGERYRDEVDHEVENEAEHGGRRDSSPVRLTCSPLFGEDRQKEHDAHAASEQPRFGSPPTLARRSRTDPTLPLADAMLSNPWTEEADSAAAPATTTHPPHPPVLRFASSPVFPVTASPAALPAEHHPAPESQHPPLRPGTPTRAPSEHPAAAPTTPGLSERNQSLVQRLATATLGAGTRKSIYAMASPHGHGQLLASPLSSTLSAVVADLKRGGGVGSFRGRALFQSQEQEQEQGAGVVEGEGGNGHADGDGGGGGDGGPVTRSRSLSETLTDFWRGRGRG